MTGFGRARARRGELSAEAEARSVNGRFLQVRCRLPSELLRLEPRVEALVKRKVTRGSVDVLVRVRAPRGAPLPRVNRRVLSVYREALSALPGHGGKATRNGKAGDDALLLTLPGVISVEQVEPSEGAMEKLVLSATEDAVDQLDRSRTAEGQRLRVVLRREVAALQRHLQAVARLAPAAIRNHHAALRRRVEGLLNGSTLAHDDPALLRELALLADRSDITEELDRLKSHVAALADALAAREPVGRQIDFLLQEIGREVNTVGAKANDAAIAERVVRAKSVVEKLREQAANIE